MEKLYYILTRSDSCTPEARFLHHSTGRISCTGSRDADDIAQRLVRKYYGHKVESKVRRITPAELRAIQPQMAKRRLATFSLTHVFPL